MNCVHPTASACPQKNNWWKPVWPSSMAWLMDAPDSPAALDQFSQAQSSKIMLHTVAVDLIRTSTLPAVKAAFALEKNASEEKK